MRVTRGEPSCAHALAIMAGCAATSRVMAVCVLHPQAELNKMMQEEFSPEEIQKAFSAMGIGGSALNLEGLDKMLASKDDIFAASTVPCHPSSNTALPSASHRSLARSDLPTFGPSACVQEHLATLSKAFLLMRDAEEDGLDAKAVSSMMNAVLHQSKDGQGSQQLDKLLEMAKGAHAAHRQLLGRSSLRRTTRLMPRSCLSGAHRRGRQSGQRAARERQARRPGGGGAARARCEVCAED